MHYTHTLRCGEQLKGVVAMNTGTRCMERSSFGSNQPCARNNKHESTVDETSPYSHRVRVGEGLWYLKELLGMKSLV